MRKIVQYGNNFAIYELVYNSCVIITPITREEFVEWNR